MLKLTDFIDFTVVKDTQFPKNLEFYSTNQHSEYRQPGIFFMFYKAELIYIGFFYPSQKNSDVRTERMSKEIASITMRGKQVVFTKSAFDAHQNCVNYPIFHGEVSDNGFQTSVKRVEFADENWNSFKTNDFLEDFTFYWFREEKNLNHPRKDLEKLTQELRTFYKPTCNG